MGALYAHFTPFTNFHLLHAVISCITFKYVLHAICRNFEAIMEKFNSPPASPKIGKGGMQHLFNERVSPSHYFTSHALGYSRSTNNSCVFSLASVGD